MSIFYIVNLLLLAGGSLAKESKAISLAYLQNFVIHGLDIGEDPEVIAEALTKVRLLNDEQLNKTYHTVKKSHSRDSFYKVINDDKITSQLPQQIQKRSAAIDFIRAVKNAGGSCITNLFNFTTTEGKMSDWIRRRTSGMKCNEPTLTEAVDNWFAVLKGKQPTASTLNRGAFDTASKKRDQLSKGNYSGVGVLPAAASAQDTDLEGRDLPMPGEHNKTSDELPLDRIVWKLTTEGITHLTDSVEAVLYSVAVRVLTPAEFADLANRVIQVNDIPMATKLQNSRIDNDQQSPAFALVFAVLSEKSVVDEMMLGHSDLASLTFLQKVVDVKNHLMDSLMKTGTPTKHLRGLQSADARRLWDMWFLCYDFRRLTWYACRRA